MNGVQTRFKCKLDVKRCKRFVFPPSSLLPRSNALKTKAIRYFQTDRTLTRIVSPPLNICRPVPEDYDEILQVWEDSVRHTHHFLTEEHIQFYKPLVRNHYLSAVELYIIRNTNGKIVAFMGLSDELIEMLFVSPGEQGKGYGRRLLEYATRRKQINKVDVNEQNDKALGFYLRMGFRIIGRDETDGMGKPYPILHLQLPEAENGNK